MLRLESATGWWLVTHPDHARLAGRFAEAWGNALFRKPEPRARVLHGIASHDDGWATRDAHPSITRQGKPAAFSVELVGKYSAFEEIDLADYLAVRERAVRIVAEDDAYAGLLIAMHTYNLLTAHADRTTIAPEQLPLLDSFLESQRAYQAELRAKIEADDSLTALEKSGATIEEHFRLLQACDYLSLLTCVAYSLPAHLLHPLPLEGGGESTIAVEAVTPREFRLEPWPFEAESLTFAYPARHVVGREFASSEELQAAFTAAAVEVLTVTVRS